MARPLRIEQAGGWYHITARGNERRAIFRDERDRTHFCELLAELAGRFGVRLHAYVLMDNHYHLQVELQEANLSRAIQWLNVSYSVWFNRRRRRSGHLFQGRFKSIVVDPAEWGLAVSRYLHLNPARVDSLGLGKSARVRARVGISEAPKPEVVRERIGKLRDYRWSSYRAYVGLAAKPEWLECDEVLRLGGGKKGEQQVGYRDYVESAVREGLPQSPWEELKEQVVLGGEAFLEQIRKHVTGDEQEQRRARRLAMKRPGWEEVIACVEKAKGERWEAFRDRHGDSGRDLALYLGRRACGMKLRELAEAVGGGDYAVAAMGVRRYEAALKRSATERALLQRAADLLHFKM